MYRFPFSSKSSPVFLLLLAASLLNISVFPTIVQGHDERDYSQESASRSCPPGQAPRVKYDQRCGARREIIGSQDHPEVGPPNCKIYPVSSCLQQQRQRELQRSVTASQQQQQQTVVQDQPSVQQPVVQDQPPVQQQQPVFQQQQLFQQQQPSPWASGSLFERPIPVDHNVISRQDGGFEFSVV